MCADITIGFKEFYMTHRRTNLLKASVVVDFRLAVLASLEFLDVGGAFPKIALTSNESRPSLSPDLLHTYTNLSCQ